jgi:hypothetical protein
MFKFIYEGQSHTDTSLEYMTNFGMNTEQIESVLQQKLFECSQVADKRQAAYKAESDSLFMDWQTELAAGNEDADVYKQKWLDSKLMIKARLPLFDDA